jgi:hypothetical protein
MNFWLGDRDRAIEMAATGWDVRLRGLGCWVGMVSICGGGGEGF